MLGSFGGSQTKQFQAQSTKIYFNYLYIKIIKKDKLLKSSCNISIKGDEIIDRIVKTILIALSILFLCGVVSASTLTVGPDKEYQTIQNAVNASQVGDTVLVDNGTYPENVNITVGNISILGINYPIVDGFNFFGGSGTINGFSIQKDGISSVFAGGGLIRNNYLHNCNISLAGGQADSNIMNNQIINGTICLDDTRNINITGTMVSNSTCGLFISYLAWAPTVKNCTFENCSCAVFFEGMGGDPGYLPTFSGNAYINNTNNFGWDNTDI